MNNILDNKIIINKGIFNNIDIIENSLESFKEALKKDFIIRCQVQYLKDGNFIILADDALERLFNLKDSLKNTTYEDLDYISEYKILKLSDLLSLINNKTIILEVPKLAKKALKILLKKINTQNNIIIESTNIKILKIFKKNNFKTSLLINKKNKHLINTFFKPNIFNIEIGLFDKKTIKKVRENNYVIGNVVKDKDTLKINQETYDNLVIENNF